MDPKFREGHDSGQNEESEKKRYATYKLPYFRDKQEKGSQRILKNLR